MPAATFHELYNGNVVIWFDPEFHRYFLNGERIPGVTRILERGREPYESDEIKQAADIGTAVHDFAEQCLKGFNPALPADPEARSACRGFVAWVKARNVRPVYVERVCYSRKHGFAGRIDLEAFVDDVLSIVDFKSANKIQSDDLKQVSAYEEARREESGETYQKILLRLDKRSETFEEKIVEGSKHFDKFAGLLAEYYRTRELRRRVRAELASLRERVKRSIASGSLTY